MTSWALITDGAWHHAGFVWESANRILYVDDFEVARDDQPGGAVSTSGLRIGLGSSLAPGTLWSGLINDVRIDNRVVKP